MRKALFLASSSLLFAGAANAQQAASTDPVGVVEELVVTASRIAKAGIDQPTPVSVQSAEQVDRAQQPSVASYLQNQVPSFSGGASSDRGGFGASGGSAGINSLSLRGLGANRTLTLIDGRRYTASDTQGAVDINSIPQALILRTEVVTGGASAAWGSDAVAGVVNFVLDHKFEGIKASIEGGRSQYVDHGALKAQFTAGRGFLDDRLHLTVSFEAAKEFGFVYPRDVDWYHGTKLVLNPAYAPGNGQAQYLQFDNVGSSQVTTGGVVTLGPLRGLAFGPGGVPYNHDFGAIYGSFSRGGTTEDVSLGSPILGNPLKRSSAYARASWELNDNITVYGEYTYTDSIGRNYSTPLYLAGATGARINIDNAFLDPAVAARMATASVSSFQLGIANYNLRSPNLRVQNIRNQFTLGVDGKLPKSWTWNASYVHGKIDYGVELYDTENQSKINLAVDAVRSPVTGAIVCRSTLTNPTNGCVPLNVMGVGVASDAANAYVNGTATQATTLTGNNLTFSLQGDLFSTWAGPVGLAFGGDYRDEKDVAVSDPLSQARGWVMGNYATFSGSNHVKEGFAELNIPLLADLPWARSLDVNLAGRLTDYKYSGLAKTWKVGVAHNVNGQVRLRAAYSRDIRAPNIQELLLPGSITTQSVIDTIRGSTATTTSLTDSTANPNLRPEIGKTLSFGAVFTPRFLPRFVASVDYYSLKITGAIARAGAQPTVDFCAAGVQEFCARVIRNAAGTIISTLNPPDNINSLNMEGVDFDVSYAMPIADGDLSLNALVSYVNKLDSKQNGAVVHGAGSVLNVAGSSIPDLKATVTATYSIDRFAFTASTRFIGKQKNNQNWGPDILDPAANHIGAVAYVDLRASYKLMNDRAEIFGTIDNALNKYPPRVATIPGGVVPWYNSGTQISVYDPFGRTFRAGFRLRFQ